MHTLSHRRRNTTFEKSPESLLELLAKWACLPTAYLLCLQFPLLDFWFFTC